LKNFNKANENPKMRLWGNGAKQTIDSKLYLPKQTCSDEENTKNPQNSETPDEFNKYQRKLYVVILIATP
jgi:hypothetical protein